jgi:hypothetical protein
VPIPYLRVEIRTGKRMAKAYFNRLFLMTLSEYELITEEQAKAV